jgi:predicted kinase
MNSRRYATPLKKPAMIAVMGLSGTGKTSVARAIAAELGLRVVSSDAIRKSLFGKGEQPIGHEKENYGAEANCLTYKKLLDKGRTLLKESGGAILDATFQRAADRASAEEIANSLGANWRLVECLLSPDLIHARLDKRTKRREGHSDATWDIYLRQREKFEPLNPIDDARHLLLDTRPNLSVTSRTACDWLRENDQR